MPTGSGRLNLLIRGMIMIGRSALEWLAQRDDGIGNLPASDQKEVMEFSLMWSYFESRFLGTNANPRTVKEFADKLEGNGLIRVDDLLDPLDYLRRRYVREGRLVGKFDSLNLRGNDNVSVVEGVLLGRENSPGAILICCLTVVLRYRNNLFHGVKWAYGIQGQKGNFMIANQILMRTAEMARGE